MMELVRFGLINWYLAFREDIDVKGATAILGKNTSGKSSLLDMAQTVLTGHNKHYIRLNASAGDGKHKKSGRSIRDYCLGAYGGGKTLRPRCKTILFLGFQDPANGKAISIGVALEADESQPSERLLDRFIVPGVILSTDMFVEATTDGRERIKDWSSCKAVLERAAQGGATSFETSSESFIKNWTKIASTGGRSLSPSRLMKAIVNAISFEEIASATQFAREYVLPKSPLEISELKTSVKTYHDLHRKIRELRLQLGAADEIVERARAHGMALKAQLDYNAAASVVAYASARSLYFVNVAGAKRKRQEATDLAREIKELEEEIAARHEELAGVEQLIQASHQNSQRAVLGAQRNAAETRLEAAEKELHHLYLAVCDTVRKANAAAGIEPLGPIEAPLASLAAAVTETQHPYWPKDVTAAMAALDQVAGLAPAAEKRLKAAAALVTRERVETDNEMERISDVLDNIRSLGKAISKSTVELMNALRTRGMQPRVLCELVDVTDESWRDAAEIMLGRDREAIIVDAAHATEAKEFLRANRDRFPAARVVGTDKEDWRTTGHKPDSLAAVIRTDDPDARILIDKRLGSIRRAETTADLRLPGRAVMRDGTFDDGIVVEVRRLDHGRKLGAKAADPAALEIELERLTKRRAALERTETTLIAAAEALATLAKTSGQEADAVITAHTNAEDSLRQVLERLREIDSHVDPQLAKRKDEILNAIRERGKERDDAIAKKSAAETQALAYEDKLSQGDLSNGSKMNVAKKRAEMRFHLPKAARRDAFALARQEIGRRSAKAADQLHKAAMSCWTKASDAKSRADSLHAEIFDRIVDFQQQWQAAPGFARATSSIAGEVLPFFENLATQIRDSDLVDHEKRAEEAAISTRGMFQTAFVASLSDKIKSVYSEIDRLNGILAQHRFHGERYRFKVIRAAEYEALIEFVELAVQDDSVLLPLLEADRSKVDPASPAAVVNKLLLDENFDISSFEDYRQYFTFDLMMHNEATNTEENLERRKGTGSGAERQMPFYVAIGAALSAAWHGGKENRSSGKVGVGLALFDEAFSKMDQPNQRACIKFFESLGLQTVIAAPTEKTAIALANMDTIVHVARDGTRVEFDSTFIKERTRQEIQAEDPSSLTVADMRKMMALHQAEIEARRQSEQADPHVVASADGSDDPVDEDKAEAAA